eukprot:scaffold47462_cov61-Cyclotella_meneghiniana.AAC.1
MPPSSIHISDLHPLPLRNFWFALSPLAAPTYRHWGGCRFVATPLADFVHPKAVVLAQRTL